jgi:putative endonuclease
MYTVYVLVDSDGKFYKGMTNNLQRRLKEHAAGRTKTTHNMESLKIVYAEERDNAEQARKREKYLKSAAGRRFLKKKLRGL